MEPREVVSTKLPYANKRYDLKEFNPLPNEVGFLGGLGKHRGNIRSKAHVQRPSMNQILFKMRTTNRILFTFSEDPILAHSLTKQQLEGQNFLKSSKQIKNRDVKRDLKEKISKIQIADNVMSSSRRRQKQSTTSETEDLLTRSTETTQKIDNSGTASTARKTSRGFNLGAMKKISVAFKATDLFAKAPQPQKEEKSFREWAMEEREKRHQTLQQVSLQQIKQEREANEIFPRPKCTRLPKISTHRKTKRGRSDVVPGSEHIAGAHFGGFIENTGADSMMENETKFHVPLSMFSRAQIESKKRSLNRKKLITARLDYMKIPQIPSDSDEENCGDDDVLEDIKGLSLVRTPYFTIPTVTHGKVKRIERLKNRYLQGSRLKRVNLLLFDRKVTPSESSKAGENSDENNIDVSGAVDDDVEGKQEVDEVDDENQTQLPSMNEHQKKKFDSDFHQLYYDFLHEKYLEKLEQYNRSLNQKLNSLNENENVVTSTVTSTIVERKSFRDFNIETSAASISSVTIPPPTPEIQKEAFKKIKRKLSKNMRFSRNDIKTGGFYFDPFLLEKIHNPEKGMKITKNYTSLMRSQTNLRQRLQVNAPSFDEERCGSFYHRLVTEWDPFYLTEIRHRPKVSKFCVKTDIIKIREMVRKKFYLYFMEEDLMKLFAQQEIENEMINKTTKFIKVR